MYIGNNIEPGSAVQVYGDAKGVIESVKAKGSARRGKKNIRKLYRALSRDYALTLQFIPRQQNKTAHNLSRCAPPDPEPALPKLRKSRGLTKNHVMLGAITMFVDDIRIPGYILYGQPPNKEKYQERLNYYLEHGRECKTIQIDPEGMLLDGYISYLILKEHGITRCRVEVMADLTHPASQTPR
jgi:hypothetical protein